MYSLKDILPRTLKSLGIKKKYNTQSVLVHWHEIAGDEIAARSWPAAIYRDTLLLAVDNPVWSHHLMMLKPVLINKINIFLGEKLINDIRFQAGNLRKYQNNEEDKDIIAVLQPHKLSADELAAVWQSTAIIQDEKIRKKCYYVLSRQQGLTKAKYANGWKPCQRCNVLVPPDHSYCTVCSREHKQEKVSSITRLLLEAPWLVYKELNQFVPCTPREFHSTKKTLVHKLIRGLFLKNSDKLQEAVLIMLMTGQKPDRINQETIDIMIGKIKARLAEKVRRKNYVSSPGV